MVNMLGCVSLLLLAGFFPGPVTGYKIRCDDPNYDGSYSSHHYRQDDYVYNSRYHTVRENNKCASADVNPRGSYSPGTKPCLIRFHKISKTVNATEGRHRLSTACSSDNLVGSPQDSEFEDKFAYWPDECVADFARCYSVEYHERIFKRIACQMMWEIPEESTHISVNCTADAQIDNSTDPSLIIGQHFVHDSYQYPVDVDHHNIDTSTVREFYLVVILCVGMILVTCCLLFGLAHRLMVRPYLETWRLGQYERVSLMKDNDEEDTVNDDTGGPSEDNEVGVASN